MFKIKNLEKEWQRNKLKDKGSRTILAKKCSHFLHTFYPKKNDKSREDVPNA